LPAIPSRLPSKYQRHCPDWIAPDRIVLILKIRQVTAPKCLVTSPRRRTLLGRRRFTKDGLSGGLFPVACHREVEAIAGVGVKGLAHGLVFGRGQERYAQIRARALRRHEGGEVRVSHGLK